MTRRKVRNNQRANRHPVIVEWNAAQDPFADWRRKLADDRDPLIPELVGLCMFDMPEYCRMVELTLATGRTLQRHPAEQHGICGTTPMFLKKGAK